MGKSILALLVAIAYGAAREPIPITKLWSRVYPSTGAQLRGTDLAIDREGGLYVSGIGMESVSLFEHHQNPDLRDMTKFDRNGEKVWSYGVSGFAVALDGRDNLVVFGRTHDTTLIKSSKKTTYFFLAKYGAEGKLLWAREFGTDSYDNGEAVLTDDQGNIYAAGTTSGSFDGKGELERDDVCVLKFDPEGKMIWAKTFTAPGNVWSKGIFWGEKGTLVVSYQCYGQLDGPSKPRASRHYFIKVGGTGQELSRLRIGEGKGPIVTCIKGEDGDFYAAGRTGMDTTGWPDSKSGVYLIKYGRDWKEQWTRYWDTPGKKGDIRLHCDKLGNLYAACEVEEGDEDSARISILKYDEKGYLSFIHSFNGFRWDALGKLTQDPDGNLILMGSTLMPTGAESRERKWSIFLTKFSPHSPPSFDCEKAVSIQDRLICSDARLSALDDSIAGLYRTFVSQSRNPDKPMKNQSRWMETLRNTQMTRERLDSVLSARVFELRSRTQENVFRKGGQDER
jgi:hypothetical protein